MPATGPPLAQAELLQVSTQAGFVFHQMRPWGSILPLPGYKYLISQFSLGPKILSLPFAAISLGHFAHVFPHRHPTSSCD